ncbi:MAG: inorganic diphosphatase, partial [Candidatus Paceibacterota bacterium]
MNLYTDVPRLESLPEEFNIVVDIPMNSTSKFEYDEKGGYFKLDRTLYSPLIYPFEYGFVPQTHGEDGDALDVILLATRPTFSGCVVKSRVVGVLKMSDEAGIDHKLICAPISKLDPRLSHIKDLEDNELHLVKEIELFMADYKKLEPGKYEFVKIEGFGDREEAKQILIQG